MTAAEITVEPDLVKRLREDIAFRRIESGMRCLEANRRLLECLEPKQKNAGVLLGYLAQWVDIGFDSPNLLKSLLSRFPKDSRGSLPLLDYLHLRMAEGLVAMSEEEFEQAIAHFEFVESVEEEVRDTEMLAISNFWIGRCLRKQGRYDDALVYTVKGRDLARELGYDKMAAVMQVMESWLIFQKGKLKEAARILQDAETALNQTDDYASRGNIQSAYGRIARREGRFDRALECFAKAIEEYKEHHPVHPNVARCLVNMAFVKRLISVQLRKKLDEAAARRKTSEMPHERALFERLREEAFAELGEAWEIYEPQHNHRGMGTVHLNRGFLYHDGGELDRAGSQAEDAFRLGEEKNDYILMARARILQCMIENAKVEEQIEEASGPNRHAQFAQEFARDAVEFSKHTQNRRLLARAHVWQGLTFSNGFFDNPEAARQCADSAADLLKPEGAGYIWDDLQELKAKVLQKGRIDTALREWSEGLVGEKTFQQLTEEFAGIVIPKVWEREGRKVSRVAAKLSISPKKVRRVLHAAGLLAKP
jgi:tetratricopeptide (TPR) repeat protein